MHAFFFSIIEPTPEELSELSTPVTEFAALTTTSPRVKENDLKFEDIHPLREIQNVSD